MVLHKKNSVIILFKYIYKNVAHICSFKTNMAWRNEIK